MRATHCIASALDLPVMWTTDDSLNLMRQTGLDLDDPQSLGDRNIVDYGPDHSPCLELSLQKYASSVERPNLRSCWRECSFNCLEHPDGIGESIGIHRWLSRHVNRFTGLRSRFLVCCVLHRLWARAFNAHAGLPISVRAAGKRSAAEELAEGPAAKRSRLHLPAPVALPEAAAAAAALAGHAQQATAAAAAAGPGSHREDTAMDEDAPGPSSAPDAAPASASGDQDMGDAAAPK